MAGLPEALHQRQLLAEGLLAADLERFLEFFRECADFQQNAIRLLANTIQEAGSHLWLSTNDLKGCYHKGKLVVDVVAHG